MSITWHTSEVKIPGPGLAFKQVNRKTGYKATGADRSRPLPYSAAHCYVQSWRSFTNGGIQPSPADPTFAASIPGSMPFDTGGQAARNKAYERFRDSVQGDNAAIGTAIAEAGESLGMIQNRAIGLYRAYKDLRKGDFRGCLKRLSVSPKRKHKNLIKSAANEASGLWLEYWFGWSPLISDIGTAADQLSEPLPSGQKFKGQAKNVIIYDDTIRAVKGVRRTKTGATVKLNNPNLALAANLGLVNPASVAWEVVPFSFLADWCFDVSSFLGSYSDFIGMELSQVYTTETSKIVQERKSYPGSGTTGLYKVKQTFMDRRLELVRPLPNNEVFNNLGTSITRTASAVSLLTQILSGK